MSTREFSTGERLFAWLALLYMAVLPMSGTIALRNVLLAMVAGYVVYRMLARAPDAAVARRSVLDWVPRVWFLWAVFLFVFPLWSQEPAVAWRSLAGQWIESLLAWAVGFGLVWLLGRRGPGLAALAWASAVPNVVHLLLVVVAWTGLFGKTFPEDMPLPELWAALTHVVSTPNAWQWHAFPWGFRGLEPMHGNLGYAACQAIAVFGVAMHAAWRERDQRAVWWALLGISLCFMSIVIANSRGALLFGLLMLVVLSALLLRVVRHDNRVALSSAKGMRGPRWAATVAALGALVGVTIVVAAHAVQLDPRWSLMADRVLVGLHVASPTEVLCNGVSPELENAIDQRYADRGKDYADELLYGLRIQDGGRIMLMRAGWQLMLENPRGLDGSRLSYQKLMETRCGHPPALHFSHAHQGWVDTSLALGWAGIAILAAVFTYLIRASWRAMLNEVARPWAMALWLVATFWVLRGFADSVYREHFLQMQGLLLAYLFMRLKLASAEPMAAPPLPEAA